MAESMFRISGLQGMAHGEQIDQRGQRIHCRIGQRRQQADGIGNQPGGTLAGDQQQRAATCSRRCAPHEPLGMVARYRAG